MIAYIINYILCSIVLYIPYHLWIAQSNMHNFKRAYLLIALVLPLCIPTMEYNIKQDDPTSVAPLLPNLAYIEYTTTQNVIDNSRIPHQKDVFSWTYVIGFIYFSIALILLTRFAAGVLEIQYQIRKGRKIKRQRYTVILNKSTPTPYTFLQQIFVNETDYHEGIHPAVWRHEETHVDQWHTLDILLAEVVSRIFWINPMNNFIKRSIRLNHEYLADSAVIQNQDHIEEYCYLLLDLPAQELESNLTSQLNYKQLKNRLIMMTKKTSKKKQFGLFVLTACVMIGASAIFAQKNVLMANTAISATAHIMETDTIKRLGASSALLAEYDSVMRSITTTRKDNNGKTITGINVQSVDRKRMAYIASLMSEKQMKERTLSPHDINSPKHWVASMTKPKKRTPTSQEFNKWQDTKVYGVWIDGKKAKNTDLKKLEEEDVVLYYVSKLHGKAKVGRSYTHQLDVLTQPYYDKVFADYNDPK